MARSSKYNVPTKVVGIRIPDTLENDWFQQQCDDLILKPFQIGGEKEIQAMAKQADVNPIKINSTDRPKHEQEYFKEVLDKNPKPMMGKSRMMDLKNEIKQVKRYVAATATNVGSGRIDKTAIEKETPSNAFVGEVFPSKIPREGRRLAQNIYECDAYFKVKFFQQPDRYFETIEHATSARDFIKNA